MKRLRDLNNERVKRHREKKKTAPSPNGGAATDLGEEKSAAASRSGGTATDPVQKKKAAPLRNGGAATNVTADLKDDRKSLIQWTQAAPLEQVTKVLTYA